MLFTIAHYNCVVSISIVDIIVHSVVQLLYYVWCIVSFSIVDVIEKDICCSQLLYYVWCIVVSFSIVDVVYISLFTIILIMCGALFLFQLLTFLHLLFTITLLKKCGALFLFQLLTFENEIHLLFTITLLCVTCVVSFSIVWRYLHLLFIITLLCVKKQCCFFFNCWRYLTFHCSQLLYYVWCIVSFSLTLFTLFHLLFTITLIMCHQTCVVSFSIVARHQTIIEKETTMHVTKR